MRDLPPDFGGWSNTHRRFIRWRDNGIWERLLEILIDEPDFEWLMIKPAIAKFTLMRPERGGWQPGHEPYKRGLNTKLHLAVDAHGMPLRAFITQGATADCTQAVALIDGFTAENLLADKGYDTDAVLERAASQGMAPVIPPKRKRKDQRNYDKELYKARHLAENAFLHLKRWRGIAARYAKNTASFLAAIHIRRVFLWASIS